MEQSSHSELAQSLLNDIGEDLTYTSVYDDIRSARYEEDDQLSQGVWEHEIARADWNKVKNLCINTLKTRSKDLQIAGWLVEALTMINGFNGVATGIEFLTKFISKYWDTCYPLSPDGKSDFDQKIRILNWIFETIHQRTILLPIIGFSLYNYEYARNLKMMILQNPTQANTLLGNAKSNHIKTIEEINNIIESAEQEICLNVLTQTDVILQNIDKLSNALKKKNVIENVFTKLSDDINTIRQLFKNKHFEIKKDKEIISPMSPLNNSETKHAHNRDELYSVLTSLAEQLEKLDKHSPAPYLLKLVVSWKDKNLLEIMNDLQQGDTSAHLLLRRLLS